MAEWTETVYEHISDGNGIKNPTFTVTAAERWSIGMIQRLAKNYPDDVHIVAKNDDGSIMAHVPFEWMRIVPKKKVVLSDERRAELSERMKKVGKSKQ